VRRYTRIGATTTGDGNVEPAELFRLVLVAVTLPPLVVLARRLRSEPGRGPLLAGFVVICVSFVASVVEDLIAADFFNMVQHMSYGVAGSLALLGVVRLRRSLARRGRA
jgi:uncharacterized membrane protein YhaH (DUF805 family)